MTKIVLLCAAGMSTSALVRKMKDAAKAEDYECDISAHSVSEAKNYQSADMILLGPQVRYRLKEVQGELPNNKVEVIDMTEEQLQETITEIAFEIIANVGTARGMYIEAIQEAKAGHFDQAEQLMKDGKEAFVQGHHGHADLLEWQGQGLTWKTNIFLMHAEDQLMAADTFETIASEFIEVHQELQELKSRDGRG